jgi:hypothetical protein
VLTALTVRRSAWRDGHPLRQYAGAVDGTHWDITLRVDVMLPVTIERRQPGLSERTELIEVYALDAAPWQPTPTDAYPLIDYADLGDMAADPFVQKVQKLTGSGHVHCVQPCQGNRLLTGLCGSVSGHGVARSTESGAEPGTPRAAEEASLRRHAVADPQGQTPPQARAAAPSAAAQVPAPQPIDDPRDAIAGDVYPVMQRSDASPSDSH